MGPFSSDCVRSLFNDAIRLPNPGSKYDAPVFTINSPAQPDQLEARYYPATDGPAWGLVLYIDPVGQNRLGSIVDQVTLNGVIVHVAVPQGHNGRTYWDADRIRFYWEWSGRWYALESGSGTGQRAAALALISEMVRT